MDSRDLARLNKGIWEKIDEKKMIGYIWLNEFDDDDEDEVHTQVNLKYNVCGLCDGRGSHVNPSIDAHGISAEEFYDDPDFAEDYFSGRYDQPCNECGGKRVVPVIDPDRNPPEVIKAVEKAEEFAYQCAMERYHAMRMGY